jgi:hypothetical protein
VQATSGGGGDCYSRRLENTNFVMNDEAYFSSEEEDDHQGGIAQADEPASPEAAAGTHHRRQRSMSPLPQAVTPLSKKLSHSSNNNPAKPKRPRLLLTWRRKGVVFEDGGSAGNDEYDPLKVSAVVFGHPILTEREADYMLSQSVESWKKLVFLLTNIPYTVMAISSFFLSKVEHHAFAFAIYPLCESPSTYSFLAVCVACSSFLLHSSQVRVGHWCCSTARARTFHRRARALLKSDPQWPWPSQCLQPRWWPRSCNSITCTCVCTGCGTSSPRPRCGTSLYRTARR